MAGTRARLGVWLGGAIAAVALGLGLAPEAHAATVLHWNTPGRAFVNAAAAPSEAGEMVTNVVLPTGYSGRRCWPVLYLLHGSQAGTQPAAPQWLQLGGGALQKLNIPAIVVIPGSGNSWYVNNWFGGARRPAFESWMFQDVLPLAAHRLHICPGRSEHAIAGLSMGAYGAMYLAAQRPGYFGSAGSFSGPLGSESPNFRLFEPDHNQLWGPNGSFYALAHDPTALVSNLRHTRLFVSDGDGTAAFGEVDVASLKTEEAEFEQESAAFVARARAAGDDVTFDLHGGQHTDQTWLHSLNDMLAWNPFGHVPADPSRWTYATASTTGSAWGYRFAFSAPPAGVEQLRRAGGVLQVRGTGTVTITTPSGRRVTGRAPFDVRAGHAVAARGSAGRLRGSRQRFVPVSVSVGPATPTSTQPVTVSFTTARALPRGEEYQVGRIALSDTTGSCDDNTYLRLGPIAKGHRVTATLHAPASATFPGMWCTGRAVFDVAMVPTTAAPNLPGTILGLARTTIGG
jgi:diacylglycerol O-acyltransferase / trehalose O-mycolyltransferase